MNSEFQSGLVIENVPTEELCSGKAQVIQIIRRTDENRKLIGFAYVLAEILPNGKWGDVITRSEKEIRSWQKNSDDVELVAGLPMVKTR